MQKEHRNTETPNPDPTRNCWDERSWTDHLSSPVPPPTGFADSNGEEPELRHALKRAMAAIDELPPETLNGEEPGIAVPPDTASLESAHQSLEECLEHETAVQISQKSSSSLLVPQLKSSRLLDSAAQMVTFECDALIGISQTAHEDQHDETENAAETGIAAMQLGSGAERISELKPDCEAGITGRLSKRLAGSAIVVLGLCGGAIAYLDPDLPMRIFSSAANFQPMAVVDNAHVSPERSNAEWASTELAMAAGNGQFDGTGEASTQTFATGDIKPMAVSLPIVREIKLPAKNDVGTESTRNLLPKIKADEVVDISERFFISPIIGDNNVGSQTSFLPNTRDNGRENVFGAVLKGASLKNAGPKDEEKFRQPDLSGEKRDVLMVEQALLNASGNGALGNFQRGELIRRLADGQCVAAALQQVAGRVSPVLMRDMLRNLQSNC